MRMRTLLGFAMAFAMLGTLMMTSVAGAAGTDSDTIQVDATNATILQLTLLNSTLNFGNVSPDGSVDDYHFLVNKDPLVGADYCNTNVLQATVYSNVSYTASFAGSVSGTSNMNLTNLGAASSCAAGATIYFSPIGGSFPLTKLPGFTGSPTNGNGDTISGNVWLRDLWTNTPGSLNVTITAQIDAV